MLGVPIYVQFWKELVFTGLISVVGGIIMYPIRKIKTAYTELKDAIQSTHAELVNQRTNCLANLSDQGEKQIELLGKTVSTLEAIHLGQVEMSGFLKAQNERRS